MVHANGPSTPGLRSPLAGTRSPMLPSGMNTPWAGSDRYKDFGAQYHSQPDGHARSVHPRVLSVYASTSDFGSSPYTLAATLDTEPLARSYSGGIYPRLSSNHFQFARPTFCYGRTVTISSLDDAILLDRSPSGRAQSRTRSLLAHETAPSMETWVSWRTESPNRRKREGTSRGRRRCHQSERQPPNESDPPGQPIAPRTSRSQPRCHQLPAGDSEAA